MRAPLRALDEPGTLARARAARPAPRFPPPHVSFLALTLVQAPTAASAAGLGRELPLWSALPFVALLLAIALLPLAHESWWESNRNKGCVALGCALAVAVYLAAAHGATGLEQVRHQLEE